MTDLSIIVISFNTQRLLGACLESIAAEFRTSRIKLEVIVVDNASSDGSNAVIKEFKSRYPTLLRRHVINARNVGFARANNQGATIARGRYLLFLNSDTMVSERTLSLMARFLDDRPKVGIASCQLRNVDQSIQPQGGALPRLSTVFIWSLFLDDLPFLREILPSYQLRRTSFFINGPKTTGWVAGTAMWVRRQTWSELGGFDESLFMYAEDVELCYRARERGWVVMINPQSYIIHLGQKSSTAPLWVTGEVWGLWYIFRKHKPVWELPLLGVILRVGMGLRWLVFGILGRNEALARAYSQASSVS